MLRLVMVNAPFMMDSSVSGDINMHLFPISGPFNSHSRAGRSTLSLPLSHLCKVFLNLFSQWPPSALPS